jgi:Leucine-rich repeat (LRR) protein
LDDACGCSSVLSAAKDSKRGTQGTRPPPQSPSFIGQPHEDEYFDSSSDDEGEGGGESDGGPAEILRQSPHHSQAATSGVSSLDFSNRRIAKITAFRNVTCAEIIRSRGKTSEEDLIQRPPPLAANPYPALTKLNLSCNRLSTLVDLLALTSLKCLDVSFNAIDEVPDGIGALVALQELSLHANQISALTNIHKLKHLRILNVGTQML